MTTISASTTVGVDLAAPADSSPVVITPGVSITNPGYAYAVYTNAGGTSFFAVENQGTIGPGGTAGIHLAPGGAITNDAGAVITGAQGVLISGGAGTVTNAGTIIGTVAGLTPVVALAAGGTVSNSGTILGGLMSVSIDGGGVVNNEATGFIQDSVRISGGAGSVVNDDSMYNVTLANGGMVTNHAGAQMGGATLSGAATLANAGTVSHYVVLATADADVINSGSMFRVTMQAGGTVTNQGGTIALVSSAGAGLVQIQAGPIQAVTLGNGGTVSISASGISGQISISGAAGTVTSNGYIFSSYGGILLPQGGMVTNLSNGFVQTKYAAAISISTAGVVTNAGGIRVFNSTTIQPSAVVMAAGTVANLTSALISSLDTAVAIGGVGSVVNAGTVYGLERGVALGNGTITNLAGGSIYGGISSSGIATVSNQGSIDGGSGSTVTVGHTGFPGPRGNLTYITISNHPSPGVSLPGGGMLANLAGGTIVGLSGVVAGGALALTNGGLIQGRGQLGVDLAAGVVTNSAGGTISGLYYGARLAGTLANAGTIIGNGGTAAILTGSIENRLVLTPGFTFSGVVTASASASNTLELVSAASAGTVSGLGTSFAHFGDITIDAGADWFIEGLPRGLAGPISGFDPGDTIELSGVTATGSSYAGGVLTLDEAGDSVTLDIPGSFSASDFRVTNVAGGVDVSIACFRAGTRIATAGGPVGVEQLCPGDRVVSAFGGTVPVVWTGYRHLRADRHRDPETVWPIRVRAGALAENVPTCDLWLSPEHALYLDGHLVPVRHLVNDRSILRDPCVAITYWHVELPQHDVILAEGVPCESYLDTGNRGDFANGGAVVAVHPGFAAATANELWLAGACAPQCRDGERLDGIRRRLGRRAARVHAAA